MSTGGSRDEGSGIVGFVFPSGMPNAKKLPLQVADTEYVDMPYVEQVLRNHYCVVVVPAFKAGTCLHHGMRAPGIGSLNPGT